MNQTKKNTFFIQYHLLSILVCLISIGLFLLNDAIYQSLRYERQAIQAGEYWRVISGHFLHIDTMHLILNVTGVIFFGFLFEALIPFSQWLIYTLVLCLSVSAGLFIINQHIQWYVGFSGVLHGLIFFGGYLYYSIYKQAYILILLSILLIKIIYEQFYALHTLIQANIVVDAHFYGMVTALIFIVFYYLKQRQPTQNENT